MNKKATEVNDDLLIVQIVQVVGRLGLSMAGAMCETFVAARRRFEMTVSCPAQTLSMSVLDLHKPEG